MEEKIQIGSTEAVTVTQNFGMAAYNIPIALPAGINGFQPKFYYQ